MQYSKLLLGIFVLFSSCILFPVPQDVVVALGNMLQILPKIYEDKMAHLRISQFGN